MSRQRNIPPFDLPSEKELDAMTDTEYTQFAREYSQWHAEWWPGSCFYLPRRKTPEEREREREKSERIKREMEVAQMRESPADFYHQLGLHNQAGTKKKRK